MHWSTKLTAFSLVLSLYWPGIPFPVTLSMHTDVDSIDFPDAMPIGGVNCAARLQRVEAKNLKVAQKGFKSGHDKKVRFETEISHG